MERAFDTVHGRAGAVAGIAFGGMTDPSIIRMGLVALGLEPRPESIDVLIEAYLIALASELASARRFRLIDHVEETLHRVSGSGHAIGLGTGNVKRGADLKLARAGIAPRFAFGGFACDAEDRAELLRIGAGRGRSNAPHPRVVVIGDTPRDVAAAKAIGAECLAVATGKFGLAELEASTPTLAVADLSDERAIEFLA